MDIQGFAIFNSTYVENLPSLIQKDLGRNIFNLAIYAIAMVLYAVVIWYFYRNLAKRRLFNVDLKQPGYVTEGFFQSVWKFFIFLFTSIFVFPVVSFVWFLILSAFLLFLSKSYDVAQILLMSITIIAAARITAYYNEDLSKDVAKLIPFALLGIFIVDHSYFSIEATLHKFYSVPSYLHMILQYLISIVVLEFILRILFRMGVFKEKSQEVS